MPEKRKYLYGPVPSRRLGRSYGIDIVPFKVCTLDCVYCQLGRTLEKTVERKDYIPIESVLAELKEALAGGVAADYVTIAGSGEPTLHVRLGELVDGIRKITAIPVAILTNGTLLYRPDVRADCAKADVVMPSLDAADNETFERINCPCGAISVEKVISGLCAFREEFAGQIWLEVFLVEGINTGPRQIARIKEAAERIKPDKIQLNTAVRPTADPNIVPLDAERLQAIAAALGPRCEVIADFPSAAGMALRNGTAQETLELHSPVGPKSERLLSMLKRRPCSLKDICAALDMSRDEALGHVTDLQRQKLVQSEEKDGRVFFKASS